MILLILAFSYCFADPFSCCLVDVAFSPCFGLCLALLQLFVSLMIQLQSLSFIHSNYFDFSFCFWISSVVCWTSRRSFDLGPPRQSVCSSEQTVRWNLVNNRSPAADQLHFGCIDSLKRWSFFQTRPTKSESNSNELVIRAVKQLLVMSSNQNLYKLI